MALLEGEDSHSAVAVDHINRVKVIVYPVVVLVLGSSVPIQPGVKGRAPKERNGGSNGR